MIKISKAEAAILAILVCFGSFTIGWFARGARLSQPLRVEAERTLETLAVTLPAPSRPARVDLNTASAEELQTLPGIGEKRAEDIIAYREQNGPFRYPEDLLNIPGIGKETLNGILDYITVGEETP